jgi:hypothetical protein
MFISRRDSLIQPWVSRWLQWYGGIVTLPAEIIGATLIITFWDSGLIVYLNADVHFASRFLDPALGFALATMVWRDRNPACRDNWDHAYHHILGFGPAWFWFVYPAYGWLHHGLSMLCFFACSHLKNSFFYSFAPLSISSASGGSENLSLFS